MVIRNVADWLSGLGAPAGARDALQWSAPGAAGLSAALPFMSTLPTAAAQPQLGAEIGEISAWLRLTNRLRIKAGLSPVTPELLPYVLPVTQIDHLLMTPKCDSTGKDLSGASGGSTTFFSVPKGKRWTLSYINREATTGACALQFYSNAAAKTCTLTTPTTSEQTFSNISWCMEEDDALAMRRGGNAADTGIDMVIIYTETDSWPTPAGPGV